MKYMKYLKKFEENREYNFRFSGKWIYFKINSEGSLAKLKMAIEKTGYAELYYKSYELDDDEEEYNPAKKTFYLAFNPTNEYPGRSQTELYLEESEFVDKYEELEYGGEITIPDHEVEAKKFNI